MRNQFEPYRDWLGIPLQDQPPDYYQLLGLEQFESNVAAIREAAAQRVARLKEVGASGSPKAARRLMREIAAAEGCLTHRQRKTDYDAKLRCRQPAGERSSLDDGAPSRRSSIPLPVVTSGADQEPEPPPVIEAATAHCPSGPDDPPPAAPTQDAQKPADKRSQTPSNICLQDDAATGRRSAPLFQQAPQAVEEADPAAAFPQVFRRTPGRSHRRDRPSSSATQPMLLSGWLAAQAEAAESDPTGDAEPASGGGSAAASAASAAMASTNGDEDAGEISVLKLPRTARTTRQILAARRQSRPFSGAVLVLGGILLTLALAYVVTSRSRSDAHPAPAAIASGKRAAPAVGQSVAPSRATSAATTDPEVAPAPEAETPMELRRPTADTRPTGPPRRALPAAARPLARPGATGLEARDQQDDLPPLDTLRAQIAGTPLDLDTGATAEESQTGRLPKALAKLPPPRETIEITGDPAEVLVKRGLVKQDGNWLLPGDDHLQEVAILVEQAEKKSAAADAGLKQELQKIAKYQEERTEAGKRRNPEALQAKTRQLQEAGAAYRQRLRACAAARGELIAICVRALQQAEKLETQYQLLQDEPEVFSALQLLGPTHRLGRTTTYDSNRQRLSLTEQTLWNQPLPGYSSQEHAGAFATAVIINERVSALCAIRWNSDINLLPTSVLVAAGVEIPAGPEVEVVVSGTKLQARKLVIPALRIGRALRHDVEAYALPESAELAEGLLGRTAFPDLKLDFDFTQNLVTVQARD